MKNVFLTLIITVANYCCFAQSTFPTDGSNVGIGTLSPQTNLHIFGNSGTTLAIQDNSSAMRFITFAGTNYIQSGTGLGPSSTNADLLFTSMYAANTWMTIQGNTGNIGIGTPAPADILDVQKDQNAITNFYFRNPNTTNTNSRSYLNLISGNNSLSLRSINGDNNYLSFNSGLFGVQFQSNDPAMAVLQSGNVGIGTTNPLCKLDVKLSANQHIQFTNDVNSAYAGASGIVCINDANSAYTPLGFYASNYYFGSGNVGIGTTTPQAVLDVAKTLNSGDLGSVLARLPEGNSTGGGTYLGVKGYDTQLTGTITNINDVKSFSIEHSFYGVTNSSINFLRGGGEGGGSISFNTYDNTERMRILYNGNVAIGTTDPKGYKFAVAGSAIAESMTVKLQANWPDVVFKKDYTLMPLSDVKTYIDKNQHLPEIPAAAEVEKDGVNLGEMNRLLVKKVEELTLYLIEQQKEIDQLKAKINSK